MENQMMRQRAKLARKEPHATRQQAVAPLVGSQQSNSSHECHDQNHNRQPTIETPCKQIAALKLTSEGSSQKAKKKNKNKRKLLGSKSLSQLVPISFFHRKQQQQNKTATNKGTLPSLTTTRSFPNGAFNYQEDFGGVETCNRHHAHQQGVNHQLETSPCSSQTSSPAMLSLRQVQSLSLMGMPRQSTSNPLVDFYPDTPSSSGVVSTSNISPIISSCGISQNQMIRNVVNSTPTIKRQEQSYDNCSPSGRKNEHLDENAEREQPQEVGRATTKASNKYKALKNTALVLRDVKNSLGLRMKAKQESQAFSKLTNELATPPTKLYSPFNIYTPGCADVELAPVGEPDKLKAAKREPKSRRKLNLTKGNRRNKQTTKQQRAGCTSTSNTTSDSIDADSGFNGSLSLASGMGDESMTTNYNNNQTNNDKTPKGRIALRHKKHLMQVNKFAGFESPAGRLRETVKDVEQFQQCIEDISLAIRARGSGGGQLI